jgi:putative membrane protein
VNENKSLKYYILLFLKGVGMGAANVIPGVSGGTIAFITGIYDDLINSLKSFDVTAIKLLTKFKIKEFLNHINFPFLAVLMGGVGVSLITIGKGLKYLFEQGPAYEIQIWAFFFGLILASVIFVGRTIKEWNTKTIIVTVLGVAIAIALAFMKPASQNESFAYIILCGVVAMSSMLLPGLSGSFVLILMGNYQLIMLEAIPEGNLKIIAGVGIGAVLGFVILARVISYLLKNHESATIGGLTGFIFGSLLIIWPWKTKVFLTDDAGVEILKKGEKVVQGYEWYLPSMEPSTFLAIGLAITGFAMVYIVEKLGAGKDIDEQA